MRLASFSCAIQILTSVLTMVIRFRNSLAACPHWRTCPIPGSLLMCCPGSFPASHGDWGTIPDSTSAACGTVHSLPVWPLSRQYLPLMGLEQGACVWHHQSLLILLKVNRYLPARVPARRASFPKGAAESGGVLYRHRRTVRWIEYARHTAHTQSTVSQTHVSARPQYHDDGTRPDTTTFLC